MECINKIITEVLKFLCRYLNLCAIPWLWGISHVTIGHEDHVLEIGCGNGKRIKNLIQKAPSGQVFGLDKSEEKIEEAKKLNKKEIEEENCAFVAGDPEHLPFERNYFHLVTAYNSLYKWENPEEVFKDILRVLRPGSVFLLVDKMSNCPICEYITGICKTECEKTYTLDALKSMLEKTGFVEIETDTKFGKTAIAARKPERLAERYDNHERFAQTKKYFNRILSTLLCIGIMAVIIKLIKRK
ncbi:class I SAM-dependent methyltransferase [Dialister micraerophilus]|uniref:Methyltransferase domain-containing protein n=1 Tax=Dialister micraerophilus DSM 19965 TaxID=888062 RepID=F2BWF4_9FIRM|nr:class I SAM-dependent methyltransferase [Dialister micraerophilus]EGF14821.1 hypothetical protein HMPREF9083_0521 [Dialister micraerophilus DSM 19965]MDK8284916.1 class I SAM-dependent methyltransferase [Dialister micraerophilus]MDU5301389.1 class I SAM-dependent methyltransferase [Dialister micraerophilus]